MFLNFYCIFKITYKEPSGIEIETERFVEQIDEQVNKVLLNEKKRAEQVDYFLVKHSSKAYNFKLNRDVDFHQAAWVHGQIFLSTVQRGDWEERQRDRGHAHFDRFAQGFVFKLQ